jgi:ketosteroid isomerase-like protein
MKTTILISGLTLILMTSWTRDIAPVSPAVNIVKLNSEAKESTSPLPTTAQAKVAEEPLETINRWFARFKAGASAEELAGFYAEDAVMWIPGDTKRIPWVGKRTGRKDIAEHYKVLWKNIKSEKLEITDILTKGNRVVVLGHLESRYLGNNKLITSDFSMNIIVENGLIKSYSFLEDSFDVSQKVRSK